LNISTRRKAKALAISCLPRYARTARSWRRKEEETTKSTRGAKEKLSLGPLVLLVVTTPSLDVKPQLCLELSRETVVRAALGHDLAEVVCTEGRGGGG